jgi:LysM repeat protein
MNRRDTIIVAVLLNAGLLVFLFATSLKGDAAKEAPATTVAVAPSVALATPPTDEVDLVARQYTPPVIETKPDFSMDLEKMGMATPTLSPSPEAITVAASAPEPAMSTPSYKEVTVKKGDVLERIARHNRVSVEEIMKLNGLSSTRLKIGQVLKVPSSDHRTVASSSTPREAAGEKFYIVKNGDNPWTIAVKNHMKVEELLKLNNLDEEKARRLKAGDRLRIQ